MQDAGNGDSLFVTEPEPWLRGEAVALKRRTGIQTEAVHDSCPRRARPATLRGFELLVAAESLIDRGDTAAAARSPRDCGLDHSVLACGPTYAAVSYGSVG